MRLMTVETYHSLWNVSFQKGHIDANTLQYFASRDITVGHLTFISWNSC